MTFELSVATEADLSFVMATERLEGYDAVVGRWDEAKHRLAHAADNHAYFIGLSGGERVGFAILRDWNSPERVTLLQRVAVYNPGHGVGKQLLKAVIDKTFQETSAHRLWLGVFPDNIRARRAYEAVGFGAEGVARENAFFGGIYKDELIMSILRPEWSLESARRNSHSSLITRKGDLLSPK